MENMAVYQGSILSKMVPLTPWHDPLDLTKTDSIL